MNSSEFVRPRVYSCPEAGQYVADEQECDRFRKRSAELRVPPLTREETVEEVTGVEGVSVLVVPAGATGWKLKIQNESEAAMSVVWDESSFVRSDGVSGGRLIGGETRRVDVGRAQPPAPLAPQASIVETVFVEKMLSSEIGESDAREAEQKYGPKREIRELVMRDRSRRAKLIVGGKLHVTITTAKGKHTWTGTVNGPEQPDEEESDEEK